MRNNIKDTFIKFFEMAIRGYSFDRSAMFDNVFYISKNKESLTFMVRFEIVDIDGDRNNNDECRLAEDMYMDLWKYIPIKDYEMDRYVLEWFYDNMTNYWK